MSGRNRATCFFITINDVTWSKSTIGNWLKDLDEFEEIAIGEEIYHPPLNPETGELEEEPDEKRRHQHIYLKTKDKKHFDELQQILEIFMCEETFSKNIQVRKK